MEFCKSDAMFYLSYESNFKYYMCKFDALKY